MSYFGIKDQGEALRDPPKRIGQDGSKVRTILNSRVRLVLDNTGQVQTSQKWKTFCLTDGRPLFSEHTRSADDRASSQSYADAITRAWGEHGTAFLSHRDITTSLVLWDASSDQLILARAQNGVPPIFFVEQQDALLWSNSIKMLLRHGVEAKLDRRALGAYFALGYVPSPWTLFRGIRKVPAGQFLEWSQGSWTFRRHREPVSVSRSVHDPEAKATELKRRLCKSLDQVVDTYDRVGVLLSSGVDSSLLVGLLHSELGAQVEAFTFEYSDYDGKYNEYNQARRLTRQYDIPHHKVEYNGEWLGANLMDAIKQYEEPFSYGNHTARLDPVSQRGIDTLINGTKGEIFISRTANYALKTESYFSKILGIANHFLDKIYDKHNRITHFLDISSSLIENIFYDHTPINRVLSDETIRSLYEEDYLYAKSKSSIVSLFRQRSNEFKNGSKQEKLVHLKNSFIMPDHIVWWNYRWANAHGLEMTSPYFAPDVWKWMDSLKQPLWPPYQESIRKVLIRRAAATVMPKEIAYNRKIAQSAPFWEWFQGPLKPLLNEYLSPAALRKDGFFNVDFVQQELQKHIYGYGRQPYLIWTLLCFMVWKRTFLESGDFS